MKERHILNQSTALGLLADNVVPSNDAIFSYVPLQGRREMPLNQSNKKINGKYRSGGAWLAREDMYSHKGDRVNHTFLDGRYTYTGRFKVDNMPWGVRYWPQFDMYSNSFIMSLAFSLGPEAIGGMNPTKPAFTAASSLFELRELPGQLQDLVRGIRAAIADFKAREFLRTGKHSYLSKTAQWHLALSFGWLPILSDIRNFIRAREGLDKKLKQLIRDAERPVRRERTLYDGSSQGYRHTIVHPTPYNPNMWPSLPVYAYGVGNAITTGSEDYNDKYWAVAQWRYFLPPGPRDETWNRKMRRRVMGGRITPDALYAVMPWSWLVDYFFDVGNFVDATSSGVADLVYYDYCYVMQTANFTTQVACSQVLADGKTYTASVTHVNGWKSRVVGSLFGFGVKQSDLSLRQLAILGALGFSRLP